MGSKETTRWEATSLTPLRTRFSRFPPLIVIGSLWVFASFVPGPSPAFSDYVKTAGGGLGMIVFIKQSFFPSHTHSQLPQSLTGTPSPLPRHTHTPSRALHKAHPPFILLPPHNLDPQETISCPLDDHHAPPHTTIRYVWWTQMCPSLVCIIRSALPGGQDTLCQQTAPILAEYSVQMQCLHKYSAKTSD